MVFLNASLFLLFLFFIEVSRLGGVFPGGAGGSGSSLAQVSAVPLPGLQADRLRVAVTLGGPGSTLEQAHWDHTDLVVVQPLSRVSL